MPDNKRELVKEPEYRYKGPTWQSIESRHTNIPIHPQRDVVESPECTEGYIPDAG